MSTTCKVATIASLLTAALLGSPSARAQPIAQQDGFDKPLGQGQRQSTSVNRSVITQSTNGNSVALEMENGRVTSVTHNSKPVPKDRYRIENNTLTILDDQGKALHEMQIPTQQGNLPMLQGLPLMGEVFRDGPRVMLRTAPLPQPRVRMGIMMAADNEADIVTIQSVTEGSPAQKAGLKAGDIIERIDTKPVRTQQDVRAALEGKQPGDKVSLQIERNRDQLEVVVELAKADEPQDQNFFPMRSMVMLDAGELTTIYDNAEKELASALESLSKENTTDSARKALQAALASIRESREQMQKLKDHNAANGFDLNGIERWGERWGQQMGGQMGAWGEDFGNRMQEWGEQMRNWAEQLEREAPVQPRLRNNENPNPNPDAETRELRDMLRAMQERLDRLEQQRPEDAPR